MDLYHLIYVSRATVPVDNEVLARIKTAASTHNPRSGITGLLLYSRGHFIQLLEGPRSAITNLYDHICVDNRHADVELLLLTPVSERFYPSWAMGVYDLESFSDQMDVEALANVIAAKQSEEKVDHVSVVNIFESFRHLVAGSGQPEPTATP
ncbi:MAG: BLUF domain-containing protein [Phycisphaerae bacterium]